MGASESCLAETCPCLVDICGNTPPTPNAKNDPKSIATTPSGDTVTSTPQSPEALTIDQREDSCAPRVLFPEDPPEHAVRKVIDSLPTLERQRILKIVVLLQALIRRHITLARYNLFYKKCVMIQCWMRCRQAKKKLQDLRLKKKATLVQKQWRMTYATTKLKKQKGAAIIFQAICRGSNKRSSYERKREKATEIQRIARGYISRKKYAQSRHAIIFLQSLIRMYVARTQHKHFWERLLVLQCWMRCRLAAAELAHLRQNLAATVIQRNWKMVVARLLLRRKRESAVKIQSMTRGVLQRDRNKEEKVKVTKIQSVARGCTLRTQYKRARTAAIKVQAVIRMSRARSHYVMWRNKCVVLQCWSRCINAKLMAKRLHENCNTLPKIQSVARGYTSRTQSKRTRNAAIKLQAVIKISRARGRYIFLRNNCVVLQCWWRCINAKLAAKRLRESASARRIQSHWRRAFVQIQQRNHTASCRLQSFIRSSKQRRLYQSQLVELVKIQRFSRCFAACSLYIRQKRAFVKLQALVRCRFARNQYRLLLEKCIVLQRWTRHPETAKVRLLIMEAGPEKGKSSSTVVEVLGDVDRKTASKKSEDAPRTKPTPKHAAIQNNLHANLELDKENTNIQIENNTEDPVQSNKKKEGSIVVDGTEVSQPNKQKESASGERQDSFASAHTVSTAEKVASESMQDDKAVKPPVVSTPSEVIPATHQEHQMSKDSIGDGEQSTVESISKNEAPPDDPLMPQDKEGPVANNPNEEVSRMLEGDKEGNKTVATDHESRSLQSLPMEKIDEDETAETTRDCVEQHGDEVDQDDLTDASTVVSPGKSTSRLQTQKRGVTGTRKSKRQNKAKAQQRKHSRDKETAQGAAIKAGGDDQPGCVETEDEHTNSRSLIVAYSRASANHSQMLERMKNEIVHLRASNAELLEENQDRKANELKLLDANKTASSTFASLVEYSKQLTEANEKLVSDNRLLETELNDIETSLEELKESLDMRQASYIAEIHARLQSQKALVDAVEYFAAHCNDSNLVEEIIAMSERFLS